MPNHPVEEFFEMPNDFQEYESWMYNYAVEYLLMGNTLIYRAKRNNQAIIIPAESINLHCNDKGNFIGYVVTSTNNFAGNEVAEGRFFRTREIWHHRRPNPNSLLWGLSPFVPTRKPILFNRYTQDYLNAFYLKGATPGLALKLDRNIAEDSAMRFLRSFEVAHLGRRNMRRTIMLPKGVDLDVITPKIADQKLVDTVNMNRDKILNILRVPKHAMSLAEAGSLGSEEAKVALKFFYISAVLPPQGKISKYLTRQLREEGQLDDDEVLLFDNSHIEVLQEDLQKKAAAGSQLKDQWTLNEIRTEVHNKEPIEGGDAFPGTIGEAANPNVPNSGTTEPPANPDDNSVEVSLGVGNGENQHTHKVRINPQSGEGQIISTDGDGPDHRGHKLTRDKDNPAVFHVGVGGADKHTHPSVTISLPSGQEDPGEDEETDTDKMIRETNAQKIMERYKEQIAASQKQMDDAINEKEGDQVDLWLDLLLAFAEASVPIVRSELNKLPKRQKADDDKPSKNPKIAKLRARLEKEFEKLSSDHVDAQVERLLSVVEGGYAVGVSTIFDGEALAEIEVLRARGKNRRSLLLQARSLKTFQGVSITTTDEVIDVIKQGVKDQKNIREITRNISKRFSEFGPARAEKIARTEVLTASSLGKAAALQDAASTGLEMVKVWLTAGDTRVRGHPTNLRPKHANHFRLQGAIANKDEPFDNGLQYPRDVKARRPDEVINCRCDFLIVPAEDLGRINIPTN